MPLTEFFITVGSNALLGCLSQFVKYKLKNDCFEKQIIMSVTDAFTKKASDSLTKSFIEKLLPQKTFQEKYAIICSNVLNKLINKLKYNQVLKEWLDSFISDNANLSDIEVYDIETSLHQWFSHTSSLHNNIEGIIDSFIEEFISNVDAEIQKDPKLNIYFEVIKNGKKEEEILASIDEVIKQNNNILDKINSTQTIIEYVCNNSELIYERLVVRISRFIKENEELTKENNVKEFFIPLTSRLYELFEIDWKDELISNFKILKKPLEDSIRIDEIISFIKSNENCYDIIHISSELLSYYLGTNQDNAIVNKIRNILKYPRFNKVLFVAGASGSGKSSFINTFFLDCIDRYKINKTGIIPINVNLSDINLDSFEEGILSHLYLTMGIENVSIEIIAEALEKIYATICFCIDDINSKLNTASDFNKIVNCIEHFSKYNTFKWIISVNTFDYYILESNIKFLKTYSISYDSLLRKESSNSPFNKVLNLDDYNSEKDVVKHILNMMLQINISDIPINIQQGIATPQEANMFVNSIPDSELLSFPSTYFEYVESITNFKDKKIQCHSTESIGKSLTEIIDEFIFNKDDRIDIKSTSITDIEILRSIQLLSKSIITTEIDDPFSIIIESNAIHYNLQTLAFWCMKSVKILCNRTGFNPQDLLLFNERVREWLIPCYVFYNYNNLNTTEELYRILDNSELLSYTLFCARKTSNVFCKTIYNYLTQNECIVTSEKSCYAVLYFVYYSTLKISEKLKLCNFIAKKIDKYHMVDLYKNIFASIINSSLTTKKMKKNLLEISTCEVDSINMINGYVAGRKYYDLIEKSSMDLITVIQDIIYWIRKHPQHNSCEKFTKNTNKSFLDYFLRCLYEVHISKHKIELKQYYDNLQNLFNMEAPFGSYIKRNLTCAAGNLFSNNSGYLDCEYREKYIELVHKYANSRNKIKVETAWFLISNSINYDAEEINRIHPLIYKELLKLKDNKQLYSKYGSQMEKLIENNK